MDSFNSQIALHFSSGAKSSMALLTPLVWSVAIVAGLAFTVYLLRCYAQERRFRRHVTRRKERSRNAWSSYLAEPGSPRWHRIRAAACGATGAKLRDATELESAGSHFLRAA